jgi:cobalt-zinc-cadmium resistance protein CzcA
VLPITLEQAVDSALRNNLYLKGAALRSEAEEALIGSGWDLPQTNVDFEYGQVNTNANDDRISLSQSLSFPTVYAQRRKMLKHNAAGVRWEQALRQREVRTQVNRATTRCSCSANNCDCSKRPTASTRSAVTGEEQRFDLGSSNVLQRATARTQAMLMRARVQQVKADLEQARTRLAQLVNCPPRRTPHR